MILNVFGKIRKEGREAEIKSQKTKFGLKAFVVFRYGAYGSSPNKRIILTLRNLSEVHYLYPVYFSRNNKEESRIAFESDIHQTGCTRNCIEIEHVTVTKDTELVSEELQHTYIEEERVTIIKTKI